MIQNDVADDMKAVIEDVRDNGDSTTATLPADIFVGTIPDDPACCLTIHNLGGHCQKVGNGEALEMTGLDFHVRDTDYTAAAMTANVLREVLLNWRGSDNLSASNYKGAVDVSSPRFLGNDGRNRFGFVVSCVVYRQKAPDSNS